jgi:hypothetical protein
MGQSDDGIFLLLVEIKNHRPISARQIDIDTRIVGLISKYPLLKYLSASLASQFSQVVCLVMKDNFIQALGEFIMASTNIEIVDSDMEAYILLGVNLSAIAKDTNTYIYFKKIWISYLLDCSRNEEAEVELDEFGQILPNDDDFTELRNQLMSKMSKK